MNKKQNNQYVIIGRRWFDRVYGNTYHSVEVYKNGELLEREPFDYGYGDHYNQCALTIIIKHDKKLQKLIKEKYTRISTLQDVPPLSTIYFLSGI